MSKILDTLAEALLRPVNRVVTIFLGVYTVAWGLWVVMPGVDTFNHAQVYSALMSFIPHEFVWGIIAIVAGVLTLTGLVKHFDRTTWSGVGRSGIHWTIIAIFYFMGDVANTAGITATFVAFLSFYIYLNCKINHDLGNTDEC